MAAVISQNTRSHLVGGILCGLAILALRPLPELGDGDPPRDPIGDQIEEKIEDIRTGKAEEDAEGVAEEAGLVPMASPCTMRRARQAPGVEQSWRHRFAAATIATGNEPRIALLEDLAVSAGDDLTRWRVDIAFAELGLRSGDDALTRDHLERAATRNVPDTCRADEAFFLADLADTPAGAARLLDRAVALDPGFWSAQERLALLAASGTGSDPQSCEADALRALGAVVQLGALARRDVQFERLNRALEGMPINGRTALLRGMILRQTGETAAARDAYVAGLNNLDGSPCDAILSRALSGMIDATEDAG